MKIFHSVLLGSQSLWTICPNHQCGAIIPISGHQLLLDSPITLTSNPFMWIALNKHHYIDKHLKSNLGNQHYIIVSYSLVISATHFHLLGFDLFSNLQSIGTRCEISWRMKAKWNMVGSIGCTILPQYWNISVHGWQGEMAIIFLQFTTLKRHTVNRFPTKIEKTKKTLNGMEFSLLHCQPTEWKLSEADKTVMS